MVPFYMNLPKIFTSFAWMVTKPFWSLVSLQLAFSSISKICLDMILPQYSGVLIGGLGSMMIGGISKSSNHIIKYSIIMMIVWFMGQILGTISRFLQGYIYPAIEMVSRTKCFAFLQSIPLNIFQNYSAEYLENNSTYIADSTSELLREVFENVIPMIFSIIFATALMFHTHYIFGILTISWAIIHVFLLFIFNTKIVLPSSIARTRSSHRRTSINVDLIRHQVISRVFCLKSTFSKRLNNILTEESSLLRRYINLDNISNSIQGLVCMIMMGGIFLWMIYYFAIISPCINITQIGALIAYNRTIIESMWALSSQMVDMAEMYGEIQGSLDVFSEIYNKYPHNYQLSNNNSDIHPPIQLIEINNLNFKRGNRTILNNVNFKIHAGESILIMGPSGCGKTTLVNIISSIIPSKNVIINGQPLHLHKPEFLLQYVTYITQGNSILNTTIHDNIMMGSDNHNTTTVEKETRMKNICQSIGLINTNFNLHRLTGTDGVNLSGGEKQRVSYARGLMEYKDGNMIICDELTSGLDIANSCRMVQDLIKLSKNTKQKSILIFIEHFSVVAKLVDRVCFFYKEHEEDQHYMVDISTHKELLGKHAQYRSYFDINAQIDI